MPKKEKPLNKNLCIQLLRDMLEGREEWEECSLWQDNGYVSFYIKNYRFEFVTEEAAIEFTRSVQELSNDRTKIIKGLFEDDFTDEDDPVFKLKDDELERLSNILRYE